MQKMLQTWQGLLQTTGGALVPKNMVLNIVRQLKLAAILCSNNASLAMIVLFILS